MPKRGAPLDPTAAAPHLLSMKRIFLLAALATSPALSETKMTEERFDTFSKNSTVYFSRFGAPYGAEQYLSDKRVIWTFMDGTCQRGVWFAERDEICFLYEGQANALCWYFFDDGAEKRARVVGDPPEEDLVVVGQDDKPLICPGPDVGVSYTPAPGDLVVK